MRLGIHGLVRTPSSYTGELRKETFSVQVLEGSKEVLRGEVRTGKDGFFELWLPRNKVYVLEIRQGSWTARGEVATHAQNPTCLTTFRLVIPDSVSSSPNGDELTRPKGYAFFAERSEGCALGFKKIAS